MTEALVTVIIPVKNEESDLHLAINSIAGQSYPSDRIEVALIDGDSSDRSVSVGTELLSAMPLHRFAVLSNPGGNTPSNLNMGLSWAQGDFVVRVDARSQIPPDYISRTVGVLQSRDDVAVTGGSQVAVARSAAKTAIAIEAALNNPVAMGGSRYRRQGAASGPADTVYLGVFRRSQLVEAGGWNEHFSTNQDFELNHRMAGTGKIWFESGLPVNYLPRQTIREIARQYHRFGRWKAHYWRHTGHTPNLRQAVMLTAPPLAAGLAVLGVLRFRRVSGLAAALAAPSLAVGNVRAHAVNAVIAASWWTGVVRGLISDTVR